MRSTRSNNVLEILRKNNNQLQSLKDTKHNRHYSVLSKVDKKLLQDLITLSKEYTELEIPTNIIKSEFNRKHLETIIQIMDTWPEKFNFSRPCFYPTTLNILKTANISNEFRNDILEALKFYSEKTVIFKEYFSEISSLLSTQKTELEKNSESNAAVSETNENSNPSPLNLNSDAIILEAMEAKLKNIPLKHFIENLGGFSNLRTNPDFGTLLADLKKIYL